MVKHKNEKGHDISKEKSELYKKGSEHKSAEMSSGADKKAPLRSPEHKTDLGKKGGEFHRGSKK